MGLKALKEERETPEHFMGSKRSLPFRLAKALIGVSRSKSVAIEIDSVLANAALTLVITSSRVQAIIGLGGDCRREDASAGGPPSLPRSFPILVGEEGGHSQSIGHTRPSERNNGDEFKGSDDRPDDPVPKFTLLKCDFSNRPDGPKPPVEWDLSPEPNDKQTLLEVREGD